MPIKLIPPKEGRSQYFYAKGKHLEVFVDRSTKTADERVAKIQIKRWEKQIERGEYIDPRAPPAEVVSGPPMFLGAAVAYMKAGGERKYIAPIIEKWRTTKLSEIDQTLIDTTADELYPNAPASTKNRQFYTPVSAILKRAGRNEEVKRPIGWRGKSSQSWLEPEQAFPLIANCYKVDEEFGLFCLTLCYTGERLSEPLKARLRNLNLGQSMLYIPDTKNGDPRPVHLPPVVVEAFRNMRPRPVLTASRSSDHAGIPFLERPLDARIFRFHPGGYLRDMLKEAMRMTGLSFPKREGGFHIFCHTYGTWMTRYGSLDTEALVRTKRWKSTESAARYAHTVASSEARMADVLPVPKRAIR